MDTTYKNPNANYFDLGQGGNPITMDSLTPKTPINLTPAPQDTTNYSGVINSVPDYTNILQGMQATTPQETVVNQERGRLQKITDYILGRGGSVGSDGQINTDIAKNNALETNIKNFGYSDSGDAYKQLTEVNSQINALRKEALAIPLQIQEEFKGTGATTSGVAPIEASRLRQNAIKSLGLASIAETIQGNISTASSLAERAVNIEFAPIQAELNAFRQNYELNKDALERADKKKAQQLEFTLKERERVLNDQMADKKTILGFVAEGAKNGAPTLLLDRARQSNNPMEVLSILSKYMSDPIAKEQAVANLEKTRAEVSKLNNEIKNNGISTPITNPNASKYSGALSVILGSTKFSKEQKASLVNSINSGQDPVVVIKNQAKDIMSNPKKTETEKYETIKEQTVNLQNLMSNYYQNGGKTDIFRGNIEKVINRLGQVNDPALVEIAVNIASALQQYRNAVSGTAYSEQEGRDIASIFPGINKSEGLNQSIIKGRLNFIDTTIDSNYRNVLGQTYDVLNANKINAEQSTTSPKLSVEDAYAEYLKTTNPNNPVTQPTNTNTTTNTPTTYKDMLPDMGGYKGFKLDSLFKFK